MPSLEAARPMDLWVLVPALVLADILPVACLAPTWVWACAPPPADPFSAAQEGVAAANAIAPTTPSMSGSFLTALFMIAPPILRPMMGRCAIETWSAMLSSFK